jgi:phage terminase large subunit
VFDILGAYRHAFADTCRYLVLGGGAGSGKSYFAAQKIIYRCLTQPHHRILCVRQTYQSIKESVYRQILSTARDCLPGGVVVDKRVSPLRIIFPQTKSEIIFRGMDDPEKLKSITGVTSVWVEEANQIQAEGFDEIDRRLRSPDADYTQIVLTFNPVTKRHWIYERFFAQEHEAAKTYRSTYLDNPHLPDDYYERALAPLERTNKQAYNVYALGEWGVFEGAIYNTFQTTDEYPDEYEERYFGIDFGYSDSSTAVVEVRKHRDEYYCRELVYDTGLTNSDLIDKLRGYEIEPNHILYCDAAEPQRIEELRRHRFSARPAEKAVLAGIGLVQSLHPHIRVHQDSDNLLSEADMYTWKRDKHGNAMDAPVKANDHALDALRYALFTHNYRRVDSRPTTTYKNVTAFFKPTPR